MRVKAKQWLRARELLRLGTKNLISPFGEKRKISVNLSVN